MAKMACLGNFYFLSSRSYLADWLTISRKNPAHVIFGMLLVLVRFWMYDMIWNCSAT